MSKQDLHYLKSILGQLQTLRRLSRLPVLAGAEMLPNLGSEVLADNIDWLDCFIDKHERKP